MANDDPLTKFEAVLGAISKITSEDDTLVGARCPSCGASDFVAVSDLYAQAVGRIEEHGAPTSEPRDGGLTDAKIVARFSPPRRGSAVTRTALIGVPLMVAAGYVYHRFGSIPGQFAFMVAFIVALTVFMTRLRALGDDYYARRRQWRKLHLCRKCGQVVAA